MESLQRNTFAVSDISLNENYFVLAYPLWIVLVPYGLYLTFSSYLCPTTCLPSYLPAAGLATWLGTNFNFLMGIISAIAAALHVGESVQAYYLSSVVYRLSPGTVVAWTINVFFFGIFGFWPLAFPDFFTSVKDTYCSLPLAYCRGV